MTTRRPCRPLRVERDDCLWFVSTRTVEERFWLLALLCAEDRSERNRQTRRALDRFERRADKRIAKLVRRANAERGPIEPPARDGGSKLGGSASGHR